MDKVSIYGVFEFVGFHLCKRFLEKGFRVEGVHLNTNRELFLDEKRLEIGRNANFVELQDSVKLENEPEAVIISPYDWFMADKESKPNLQELFPEFVKSIMETKSQLVFLLPIQMLSNWEELEGLDEVKDLLSHTSEAGQPVQYFYLPTIFGPWQPDSFLFQRELLNQIHDSNEQIKVREWPFDAIYVDDLLNLVIEKIDSGEAGSFLIESGIPKSWELCAELLQLDPSIISEMDGVKLQDDDRIKKLTLTEVTPYKESLAAQKKHLLVISNLLDHS